MRSSTGGVLPGSVGVSSTESFFRSSNRIFLILLGIVVICASYTLFMTPMSFVGQHALPEKPVCQCNCNCASSKMVALRSNIQGSDDSNSMAVTDSDLSRAWRPVTHVQSYQPRPSIVVTKDDAGKVIKKSYHQFVRAAYPPVGPEKGSLWDSSWFNTPVGYGGPLVPAKEDDGFPQGFVPRPECQRDTDILQNYLYANQHPEDCKTKKLLVRKHMPGYGLFAGLGLSSNYLFLASVLGRTLVDLSPNTYFSGNCDSNGLSCAFLPVSSCTADDFQDSDICYSASCWDTARVISIDKATLGDYLPCAPTAIPIGRCLGPKITQTINDILPELSTEHGEHFFQTEYHRYLTRPNQALMDFTANVMQELDITSEVIGVHIRHGDKQEGIQFPTRAYSLVVKRVIAITGIRTVFIGSDDKSVYEELPKWVDLPNVRYVWMNDPNPIVFSADQARGKGKNTIGKFLMAQTIINSQAAAYIGTRSSNAGQIVYSLQNNNCGKIKIAFDMYGDLFYNSWYCRGDIEHVGREMQCALKRPPAGAQSLIWEFGGSKTEC